MSAYVHVAAARNRRHGQGLLESFPTSIGSTYFRPSMRVLSQEEGTVLHVDGAPQSVKTWGSSTTQLLGSAARLPKPPSNTLDNPWSRGCRPPFRRCEVIVEMIMHPGALASGSLHQEA